MPWVMMYLLTPSFAMGIKVFLELQSSNESLLPELVLLSFSLVFLSSGMKRLPYTEEEFGSPPNKLARMDEPKRGVF